MGLPDPVWVNESVSTAQERVQALGLVRDVLPEMAHDVESCIMIAEWLVTGRADLALAFARQRAESYPSNTSASG